MSKPPCHHTWHSLNTEVEGSSVRYTHQCPHCGYIKTTVRRAYPKLTPELKWKRELEKLAKRAEQDGCVFMVVNGQVVIEKKEFVPKL